MDLVARAEALQAEAQEVLALLDLETAFSPSTSATNAARPLN
jgi:hypothetical protein